MDYNSNKNNLDKAIEISIIIPCLNEEKAISACIDEAYKAILKYKLSAEIIVSDNGSSDNSLNIIKDKQKFIPNLILTEEKEKGYGFVYLKGLSLAQGKYIFMADGDNSYNFLEINKFIEKLEKGADLVIGNRFAGKMHYNAMPKIHKYIGNPILSYLVRVLFKTKIKDIHSGSRALRKDILNQLNLKTGGMEFASEMIIKASKKRLKVEEVEIEYRPRIGSSKLKTINDGWRHLRFILLYSPLALFLIPGSFLFILGIISFIVFYFLPPEIMGIQLYFHPLFLSSLIITLGYQIIIFAAFAKIYAHNHLGDKDKKIEKMFKYLTIEKAGFTGIAFFLIGALIYIFIFISWLKSDFPEINQSKNFITALTLSILGIQTFFSAFMLSILGIKEK